MLEIDLNMWIGGSDGVVRVWDAKNIKPKKEIRTDDNVSHKITCITQKGSQVWLGNEKGVIHVFDKVVSCISSTNEINSPQS